MPYFPWAIICITYLRFRRAMQEQAKRQWLQNPISKYRPYTAIYGLTGAVFLILFQGYDVFSRGNAVWALTSKPWSTTLAPWVTDGIFLILQALGIWISGLKGPPLSQQMLFNGAVSRVGEETKPERRINRKLNRFLVISKFYHLLYYKFY